MHRKLRYGMIGGGRGAFIGGVHRIAAQMDGQAELVAGAFSSDPARAMASAADVFVAPTRAYDNYTDMIAAEARMPADTRLDFIVIVTPTDQHITPATLCLQAGFHVILDKPLAIDLDEALRLRDVVRASGKLLVLTHNYAGNVMVQQARALVCGGMLGDVRKIIIEYSQGWLASKLEQTGHKQAVWRTDPKRGGAGCLSDIGCHAEHLARYMTGLRVTELCADLTSFVPGRRVTDDGNILVRFEGGAKGVLHISQITVGEANNLNIRVYGTLASFEWRQEQPEELIVKFPDQPTQVWRRGGDYLGGSAKALVRVPIGHPEGFLEAFGNIYREAYRAIRAMVNGDPLPDDLDIPTIDDGVEGMLFIETALRSASMGSVWMSMAR